MVRPNLKKPAHCTLSTVPWEYFILINSSLWTHCHFHIVFKSDTFDQPQAELGKPKVWMECWNLQSYSYCRSYGNETINTGLLWPSKSCLEWYFCFTLLWRVIKTRFFPWTFEMNLSSENFLSGLTWDNASSLYFMVCKIYKISKGILSVHTESRVRFM